MATRRRLSEPLLLSLIVALTLATAYIHFWVGGLLLLLNSAGYVGLALVTILSGLVLRRALPLVLLLLTAYAAVTIAGWLVMGPYFDVAYLAKAIEVVLIITALTTVRRMPGEPRAAVAWAASLVRRVAGRPEAL